MLWEVFGGMLGAMARIAPPQPSEAMTRNVSRFLVPQPNGKHFFLLLPTHYFFFV
jgi:hypothetical protein